MTLFTIFTEAFMAEQRRYVIWGHDANSSVMPADRPRAELAMSDRLYHGTRADCERFIANQAARKGFEALRSHIRKNGNGKDFSYHVDSFLADLATEPETSGDAG